MEDLSQNGFLKQKPQMNCQPSPICEIKKKYKEGGTSSGANSCNKPPLPINNQIRKIQVTTSTKKASIGRISSMIDQQLIDYEQQNGRNIDPGNVDMKMLKRTIANRLSAQKSRLKKSHKIEEMKKKVLELEETINATKIQIGSIRKSEEMLHMQNIMMKQRLDYLSKKFILTKKEIEKKDAEARWLKGYLQILKQNALYAEKKKMESLFVGHYEKLLPDTQIHQAFHLHPNREHQNLEDIINYQRSTNPAN